MKKAQKALSVFLAACIIVSAMPAVTPAAAAASAASSTNVLTALGIDTSAQPKGFDSSSTENPYGGNTTTVSPVAELYTEKDSATAGRDRTLYGDGLAQNATVNDFYSSGKTSTQAAAGKYNAYRAAAGNFTGSGLKGQMVTVAANQGGGVYLYLADPKNGSAAGTTKTLMDSSKLIGNKRTDYTDETFEEDFAKYPYQLQNYMQIATGDFTGSGTDEIAVYVPEQGNSRIEVYQLKTAGEVGNGDWMNTDNWQLAWTYSLREGNDVSNMVSLTAGDMTGDGIDDLGITWGVYYGKNHKTTCKAVVLLGSKSGDSLQKNSTIDLKYGASQTEIVRAAMTLGDADGDGKDELVVGGQLESDINAGNANTRFLALYEYNSDTNAFIGTASGNMDLIEKDDKGNLVSGEDGIYCSSPACVVNLACVKQDGPGTKEYVYLDSVLYQQGGNGFSIIKEMDENSSLKTSRNYPYYAEYGATAVDFNGDGKETIVSMQYFMPYTTTITKKIYWWIFAIGTQTYTTYTNGEGFLKELNTSKNNKTESIAVKSIAVGSTLSYAFAAPDTDNDTIQLHYSGKHYLAYSDPKVLAVLASPPYFSDLAHLNGGDSYVGNSETVYGVISSSSQSTTKSSTISLGAYVSFEHEFSVFGVKVGSVEAETEFSHGWTTETEDTSTITQIVEYGTMGGQDTIALYSIPMDVYVYDAYVPKNDGSGGYDKQTMTVNLPYNAVVKTLPLSDYDEIAADYSEELPQIGGTILTHTVGDPGSYPKSTAGLKNVNMPSGDYMGVAYGEGGYIKQSIEIDSEHSKGTTQTNSISVKAGGGVGDVKVGITSGYEAGAGKVTTSLDGKSFSGTVVNMPAEAQGYGYNYNWKIIQYTYEGKQNFPVVTYLVNDVASPPKLPSNFDLDVEKTTDTSVTLTWDSQDLSIAGFQIYRHYDFPDGSGDYPVGAIIPADGHTTSYSFTDENLAPYTQYQYRIQAISASAPFQSVLGDVLEVRTKASEGQPTITLSDDSLLIYPDKEASVTVTVANSAAHAQAPIYQWQKKIDGVWTNQSGKTAATLTFASAGSADAGEYRCRVNQIVGEYAISAYSAAIPVTFSKRTALMELTVTKDASGLCPVLTAELTNPATDSGSIPTGTVTFEITGNNYSKSYTEAVNNAGIATCDSLTALAQGVYQITAYYSGSLVFKSVTSESKQYLAGISKGYWLETNDSIIYGDGLIPETLKFEENSGTVQQTPITAGNGITLDYTVYRAVSYNEDSAAVLQYLTSQGIPTDSDSYYIAHPDLPLWIPITVEKTTNPTTGATTITPSAVGQYQLEVKIGENGSTSDTLTNEFEVTRRPVTITAPTKTMPQTSAAQPNVSDLTIVNSSDETSPAFAANDSVAALGLGIQCLDTGGTVRTLAPGVLPGLYTTQVTASTNAEKVKAQTNYKFTFVDGLYTVTGTTYTVTGTAEKLLGETVGEVHLLSPANAVEWSTKYQAGTQVIFTASPAAGYAVAGWKINGKSVDMSYLKNPNLLAYTMLAGNLSISVSFKVSENTLSFSAEHGTIQCSSALLKSGAIVIQNAEYTFTAVPDTGYHFKEWWLIGDGTSYPAGDTDTNGNHTYTLTMPGTPCHLYAIFERDSYELTLDEHMKASYWADTDHNTSTPNDQVFVSSGGMVPGDTVITVTPAAGYLASPTTSTDPVTGLTSTQYLWSAEPAQANGKIASDGQSYTFTMTQPTKITVPLELQKFTVKWNEEAAGSEENTITISANGKEIDLAKGEAHEFDGGTAIEITAKPAYGVVFDQWKAGAGNKAVYSTNGNVLSCQTLTGDLDITARFKANDSYDVTLKNSLHGTMNATLNGEPADISSGTLKVFKGDKVVLTAVPDDGYMVGKWKQNKTVTQTTAKTWTLNNISANTSVELSFTAMAYYTVHFDAGTNGSIVAVKDESVNLESGDKPGGGSEIVFTATPDTNYMVDHWSVNGKTLKTALGTTYVSQEYTISSLSMDTDVTVTFKPVSLHTVTIDSPANGSISDVYEPDDFKDVRDGAAAVFTVTPNDGYAVKSASVRNTAGSIGFDSVVKNKDGTWTCTVNSVTEDLTVSADIAKLYTITLNSMTGGTATVNTLRAIAGESIELKAVETAGKYRFMGWTAQAETDGVTVTLNDSAEASTTFTMPESNVSITPKFAKIYTMTLKSDNGGTTTASDSHAVAGSLISLSASPSLKYKFTGWTIKADTAGIVVTAADAAAANTTFIMPESNVSVTPDYSYTGGSSGGGGGGSGRSSTVRTVVTPTNPTVLVNNRTGVTADVSGAVLPSGVSSVSLDVSEQPTTEKAALALNRLLGIAPATGAIGTPVLYDIRLLDQNGTPVPSFTGKIKVKVPVPPGMSGNLHVFWYDDSVGTLADMGATSENGFLTFESTHCSYYAVVPVGNALVLDTLSYTLAPNAVYDIGSSVIGTTAQNLKVYSSRNNIATVTKLKNGNYRVTGVSAGVTYIMYDVYDKSGKRLAHASVKITVQPGAKMQGISKKQTALF
ncbi:InlB B-repeat-containing protein [Faecalispora anaeroviscerum]|uniref:InlB B-repeat-containing protein n=1 Tax=Faecalispora anaeroviscerum TaxID=2991836 RepID=UPI0024B8D674|nr:Ig-like domain repeat protein [Faecalispora anaeroviscerum]